MAQLAYILIRKTQPHDVVVVGEVDAKQVFARQSDGNKANVLSSRAWVRADIAIVKQTIGVMVHVRQSLHPPTRIPLATADEERGELPVADIVTALEGFACEPRAVAGT